MFSGSSPDLSGDAPLLKIIDLQHAVIIQPQDGEYQLED
ncbi:hypothetical protein L21SP2_2924 [Salinispira pacifica]|uniref:Uncharacterized protein n=1 Tax=Salinispira pacifica TaxID=1307761 RepID=V5WKU8_9SPIO|nr:hypothetical protein L21SP2_2924 [Salinispira pacifica]